ncbi:hypothetical protein XELAEV_18022177mg [Xenopus laevis]|uniref:Uncharacterized protein n=1 Tax=Xenopus laevis TaxID=8355 RepID=A0A974D1V7_XENLA|nr:hypothetical protein XELAEV_18022177mg [Xenopus laevis]
MHCEKSHNPMLQGSLVDPAESRFLGNSCYPCTHTSVSSYMHLYDMDITVAARIVLWQDGFLSRFTP